jgi:hypothetical protein
MTSLRWRDLPRELKVWLLIALLGGATAGLLSVWEQLFPVPPDKLVKIYFTHSCRCAHPWAHTLEAEGFVVRMYEPETLRPTRVALHTPEGLRGCHVAEFMGYFVEGHVPAAALRRLAAEHPMALGVAMESSVLKTGSGVMDPSRREPVLLVGLTGETHTWMPAESGRN